MYLGHILESVEAIEEYVSGLREPEFRKNSQVRDAVIRRLEIIGEAVKRIPSLIRDEYPKIPWKDVAGFRDVLIHDYFLVNIDHVWGVVRRDLPKLKRMVVKMLSDLEKKIE